MTTHRLSLQPVLRPAEVDAIEALDPEQPGAVTLESLSALLAARLGTELVLDPDIITGFAVDSSNLPGRAEALARPATERELAAVLLACRRAGLPLTVSAGRSNLTGSATPEGGVVLSTVRLLTPEVSVDIDKQTVRAPVGMILEDLRKAVLEQSAGQLLFPVNPTSREDATVGGAIACNASGFTPGEVGAMRSWVEAVDFLLPNGLKATVRRGEAVSEDGVFLLLDGHDETALPVPRYRRPAIKNASGPYSAPDGRMDFLDLVIGSEGLFGIVSACTLRLQPAPADYLDLFFSLPAEENAVALYRFLCTRLDGDLGRLSALEYFGVNCRRFMDHEARLFRGDDPVGVYVQVPLTDQSVEEAAEEWFELLMGSGCGIDEDAIMLMDNDRDRAVFLEARHSMPANSLEVVQHRGTYTLMTDTVVPPDHFPAFLASTHDLLTAGGLDYLSFGHLGDCHLHFMILPEKGQLDDAVAAYDRIVATSAELGGVYSAEHGTGKRKRDDFLRCYGPDAVEQVKHCKAVLDPRFLLNRNNVIEWRSAKV